MRYFRFFPKAEYSDNTMTNITVRARVREVVRKNSVVFYPYVIKEGERPDIIAHKYYGTVDLTWLIFYANDIVDPIYDWPLTYPDFTAYMIAKYGDLETPKTTTQFFLNANSLIIDETTYDATPENERALITQYDYENVLNERKRNISLLDNDYAQQIVEELRDIFR